MNLVKRSIAECIGTMVLTLVACGVAVVAGNTTSLTQVWIWILAPLCGAALAAVVYKLLTKNKEN